MRRILTAAWLLSAVGCGSSDDGGAPADDAVATDVGAGDIGDGGNPLDGSSETAGDAPGPVTPTVSPFLGTNVAADLSRVDVTYQLKPFDQSAASSDENGYPVAGASGTSNTDIGFVLPTGKYDISFKGTGKLEISGIGKLDGAWTSVAGEMRNTVSIVGTPGDFGRFLTLKITNGAGQTVTDVHLLHPGFDYDTKTIFLPQFLRLLKPFRALRFMEWENTNGSTLVDWSARPNAAHYGASGFGEPWEHVIELVNETGKDCWITIPEHASDDFIKNLADFVRDHLDFARIATARAAQGLKAPFQLILENSNETWNSGFTAYKTFLAAAKADIARYTGKYDGTYGPTWMSGNADLMKVGQYEADRLVKIATTFRAELATVGKSDIVAPVLSGWALGTVYSDVGLRFIKDHYGDPKAYVRYVASAPYFGTEDANTGSLDALFKGLSANIDAMEPTFEDFAKLVGEYGIAMTAYEGGQGLNGTTNQPLKHLAQHDQRMYDAYNRYLALWKKSLGEALFMHFDLAGVPGIPENIFQYGFWGSIGGVMEDPAVCAPSLPTLGGTETIASVVHHCPKYRALMETVP